MNLPSVDFTSTVVAINMIIPLMQKLHIMCIKNPKNPDWCLFITYFFILIFFTSHRVAQLFFVIYYTQFSLLHCSFSLYSIIYFLNKYETSYFMLYFQMNVNTQGNDRYTPLKFIYNEQLLSTLVT